MAWIAALLALQSVKDFVEVDGARPVKLRGYGIVTGLGGLGDSPRGESARLLASSLQALLPADVAVRQIHARNAALVFVLAELPPFQKKGTRIDVSVSAVGDCRSLAGGELQITELRQDAQVWALASGRVVVQGDVRRGNVTTATVPGGALVERDGVHDVVREAGIGDVRRKTFRLLLRRPDVTLAGQLVFQINAGALVGAGGRFRTAEAVDGGSLRVRIPTAAEVRAATGAAPEVDYEAEPLRWLEAVLNRPVNVSAAPAAATVVINDATKTVAWTGEVRLRAGSVALPAPAPGLRPSVFHAEEGQPLSQFMERAAPVLGDQQLVDVVKALHAAGLVKAEVRAQ